MTYTLRDLKTDLRAGEFAWPGGYQRFFVADDGEALSFAAVRQEFRQVVWSMTGGRERRQRTGWLILGCQIHWEGEPLICAHTNTEIPSAYGDPDAD